MSPQTFIDCYKAARELAEADFPTQELADHIAAECDEICIHILRVLHETGGYVECVSWDAGRVQLHSDTTVVDGGN